MTDPSDPVQTAAHEARARLAADCPRDDAQAITDALGTVDARYPPPADLEQRAAALITHVRARGDDGGYVAGLLAEFGLDTPEGVALMCLAEALGRIDDPATVNRLIQDQLSGADWRAHFGHSPSWRVNASAFALALCGRVETFAALDESSDIGGALAHLIGRVGEPLVRAGLRRALRVLGQTFVLGQDIAGAWARTRDFPRASWSFDLLGEAALSAPEAQAYLAAYYHAIAHLSGHAHGDRVGLSVKLSALHPRFEEAQRARVLTELVPRLAELVGAARRAGVAVTVDAEEARRLELTVDVYEAVLDTPAVRGHDGFGVAVQAYQKRAPAVIDYLATLGRGNGATLPVRLVKGAYWDSEIKRAQALGLDGYPVHTRKEATDVAYLACAARLLDAAHLYPQFATHNAHTVVALRALAAGQPHEFQRLHGMGETLYDTLADQDPALRCRVYAPVGPHHALVPYLVRRLLENGANTSFVHHLHDPRHSPESLAKDPRRAFTPDTARPSRLPRPPDLFPDRRNARGYDCDHGATRAALQAAIRAGADARHSAAPAAFLLQPDTPTVDITNPARPGQVVGQVRPVHPRQVPLAVRTARSAQPAWASLGAEARAACLERLADAYEQHTGTLVHLLIAEAGRTLPNALAEVREAVDFCRYYAAQARTLFIEQRVDCPAGEENRYFVHPRGVVACVSPWNFPLSIFTGQVVAALVTGNAVLAKPAPQTPLIAGAAVRLMHACGVPPDVLHLLPGDAALGAALVTAAGVEAVAFTGSLASARAIQQALAARPGLAPAWIAETGGINAMLVDASALPDQVVPDVLRSAFDSAGQRCSALRLVCVHEELADALIGKLAGALAQLEVGDPADYATDVGPLIDAAARARVEQHLARLEREGRLLASAPPVDLAGHFLTAQVWEIAGVAWLDAEVFGPVLHLVRYASADFHALLGALAGRGHALTLGVHSRLSSTVDAVLDAVPAGNVYVNRDMIGAVVGTQPFGGSGLSGTGPKTGGPLYLSRFVVERTVSVNTAAVGGNASLYTRED